MKTRLIILFAFISTFGFAQSSGGGFTAYDKYRAKLPLVSNPLRGEIIVRDTVTGNFDKILYSDLATAISPFFPFVSLTTAGTSGASTLNLGNLNIPRYDLSTTYVVDGIADLEFYDGQNTTVIVKDSIRGGLFNYVATGTVDNGIVFNAIGKGAGYWKRQYTQSDGINVLWFGAIPDDSTDNKAVFQTAVNTAIASSNPTLYIPKTALPYKMTSVTSGVEINGSIRIISDGAEIHPEFTNLSVKALFHLGTVTDSTDIYIDGLNSVGNALEQKYIISQWGTGTTPTPRKEIRSLTLKNIQTGNQNITVNFNPKYINIDNVILGKGVEAADNSNPGLFVSYDSTFTGESCYINNVSIFAGNRDTDMFFLKAGSYKDVRFTNLTANMQYPLTGMSGDGFDMDGIGENTFIDNIRAIGCGIEIKSGNNAFGSYALNVGTLIADNPINGGISLRAIGNYNNVIVRNPVSTGLSVTGFTSSPIDGSTIKDAKININNVFLTNAGAKLDASAMMTIGNDNVNITNVNITNEFGYTGETRLGLRVSTCENVNINNLKIDNTFRAITFASASTIEKFSIRSLNVTDTSDKIFSFEGTAVNDLLIDDFKYETFTGVDLATLSGTFTNVKINSSDASFISALTSLASFTSQSRGFRFNNVVYDKILTAGIAPVDSSTYPNGCIISNVSDGRTWIKTGTGTFSLLNYFTVLPTGTPTANTFWAGTNNWTSFSNTARATTIGVMVPVNTPILSSSTFQEAFQQAQGQIDNTVKLTVNQTIAGIKTFSSSPIVPTATTSLQAVNLGQLANYPQRNVSEVISSPWDFQSTSPTNFKRIFTSSNSTANSLYVDNASTGVGVEVRNFANGSAGILIDNQQNGNGVVVDSDNSTTGKNFKGQDNGTDTFTVSRVGDVVANKYTKTGGLSTEFLMADGTVQTDNATGWAQYSGSTYTSGSPLVINATTTAVLPNNGASSSITSQLPTGVTAFVNTANGKITPQLDGDFYVIDIRFKATSSSVDGVIDVGIDIGGAQGIIRQHTVALRKGIGVEQRVALSFPVFAGSTFVANGGEVKVTSIVGNTSIYDITFVVDRTHKAK